MKKPCRKSGKTKFDTHEQAAIRAGELLVRDNARSELRTYRCPHCQKWHLTSQIPHE